MMGNTTFQNCAILFNKSATFLATEITSLATEASQFLNEKYLNILLSVIVRKTFFVSYDLCDNKKIEKKW